MALNSFITLDILNSSFSFKITKAIIKESLEELFSIECEGFFESLDEDFLLGQDFNLHPKTFMDQEAILSIHSPYENNSLHLDNNEVKHYKGIITYMHYLGSNQESANHLVSSHLKSLQTKHFFSFKLESVLKRLSLNKASRIYTHTNALEVIKKTLDFYQGLLSKEINFSHLHLTYPNKELISQYNESDLAFITRLAHNYGIFFYEDAQTIYFCDHYAKAHLKHLKYNANINNTLHEPCITQMDKEQSLRANSFTHSSFNAKNPSLLYSLQTHLPYTQELNSQASYNEHCYESEVSFTQEPDLKTRLTLKERRNLSLNESFNAKSNIYHLSLNDSVKIEYANSLNSSKDLEQDFRIVANTQILIDDALLAHSINPKDHLELKDLKLSKSYSNTLTLLPSHCIFTPSFKVKPKAFNSTQGIVIGESKEIESERNTIYTDAYGRVKVRMNLYANQEEFDHHLLNPHTKNNPNTNPSKEALNHTYQSYHHTPFLRVLSPIASNHSGFFHIPRVGDEVIVSFLDGDIDQPYVSGSLYNNTNPSLINLPFNDHQTSLSSKTIGTNEEGFNALTMSNIKDKEQIYLKAQKDYDELVQHNFSQRILNDKDSIVDGIYNERIKKIHTQTIDLAKNVNVGGEYLTNVALSKDTIVGLSHTLNVGVDHKVRVAKNAREFVGENKEVEISNNLHTIIHKDAMQNVKGNKKEVVGGHYNINVSNKMQVLSEKEMDYKSKDNILFTSNESIGFEGDKNISFVSNNITSYAKTTHQMKADNEAMIQVGETTITANQNSVIIKAGGVEVVIDAKGLVVRGGDVKAE